MSYGELTSSGYEYKVKYNRLAYFNQWFNLVKCSSVCVFLFLVLQEKQIKNVVLKLMTADSELKTLVLWYQMLEAEAISAEAWTTILIDEPWVQVLKRCDVDLGVREQTKRKLWI